MFGPRASLTKLNNPVACISTVRHLSNTSHEGGRGMHANFALSIRISEIHENSTFLQLIINASLVTAVYGIQ